MTSMPMKSRRSVLLGLTSVAGLGGCTTTSESRRPLATAPAFLPRRLAPILTAPERIVRITVCTRPFRAAGPRLDIERVGDATVIHNYGHGGSGWSLSWGSSGLAARKAMAVAGETGGPPTIAVIGCGALGLTSALQLQRLGARVVIYAKERTPFTRSMRATGTWTPDSRVADADKVDADFPDLWERMARESFAAHQTYLGTEGDPVVFHDRYILASATPASSAPPKPGIKTGPPDIHFASYGDRLRDIVPRSIPIPVETTPFPVASARFGTGLQFNVTELAHRLMTEFLMQGGRIETREFHAPMEIAALPEKVAINCTGYGAKALWNDQTITPVRGQITWLAPQPEVDYAVFYAGVAVVSRPDGIVIQNTQGGDMVGYGIEDETPDRAEAEATIARVAPLFPPIRRPSTP